MKAIKTLLAVSVIAGAAGAQAAMYDVTGSQTGVVVNAPVPTTATSDPANPTFSGSWDVTTSSLSAGVLFDPYSVHIDVGGFLSGDISYTDASYSISGGTLAYDAGTLTLTLTDAIATYTGSTPACSPAGIVCNSQPDANLEDFDLTLTFLDASLSAFSGTIAAVNDAGANGTSVYNWEFSGAEVSDVPLPAAAWLFGSGLIGLAGAVRRRRAAV